MKSYYGGRIAELPPDDRPEAELLYRRAKQLMALGGAAVVVPAFLLIALTPMPGVPSQSHLLPLELYFACFAVGVSLLAWAVVALARLRRTLGLAVHG
jgi:hypothetical protein